MDSFVRNVSDINPMDRSALEHVLGVSLFDHQQVTIQVTSPTKTKSDRPPQIPPDLPEWLNVYEGLSDAEADELHASITRANLTRHFP